MSENLAGINADAEASMSAEEAVGRILIALSILDYIDRHPPKDSLGLTRRAELVTLYGQDLVRYFGLLPEDNKQEILASAAVVFELPEASLTEADFLLIVNCALAKLSE